MKVPEKVSWIERARETHQFHASKRRENSSWRIQDTAKVLKRSVGSISEDLLIASWLRTNRYQLEKFDFAKDALAYIRNKENEMLLDDLEE